MASIRSSSVALSAAPSRRRASRSWFSASGGAHHGIAQGFLRQFGLHQHARPAQDFAHAHRAGRQTLPDGGFERTDLVEQRLVQRQRGAAGVGALEVDAALQLAARQLAHQHFAQGRLEGATLFRRAEQQVEEARVDSAELHRNRRGTATRFALGVGQRCLAVARP
jgi:hypothetical protein